jgi:hypothetical protein
MDPVSWLRELLASLQRTGLDVLDDVILEEDAGNHLVRLRLRAHMPKPLWALFQAYVRSHGKEAGWEITKLRQDGFQVVFVACSSARSISS